MDKTYLQEAFHAMELLEAEDFTLDDVGTRDLLDFKDYDALSQLVDVVDPNAETTSDIEETYIGKVILECTVCHSPIFKDVTEVEVNDDGDLVNLSDECPICHSTDGFKIIGQVAPFQEDPEIKVEIEDKGDIEGRVDNLEDRVDDLKDEVGETLTESAHKKINEGGEDDIDLDDEEIEAEEEPEEIEDVEEIEEIEDASCDDKIEEVADKVDEIAATVQEIADVVVSGEAPVEAEGEEELDADVLGDEKIDGEDSEIEEVSDDEFAELEAEDEEPIYESTESANKAQLQQDIRVETGNGNKVDLTLNADSQAALDKALRDAKTGIKTTGKDAIVKGDSRKRVGNAIQSEKSLAPKAELDSSSVKGVPVTEEAELEEGKLRDKEFNHDEDDNYQSLKEGFEKIDLEMEDKIIHVSEEEKEPIPDAEMITPVSDELEAEFTADNDVEDEFSDDEYEETPEFGDGDEEVEYGLDDFGEEDFDGLSESYLKKVYDNVDSFKTSKVSVNDNTLIIEGIIKFNSGKEKSTQFIFEAADATKDGRVRFIGENAQISRGKKSFTLTGKIENSQFIAESLNYNYRAKDIDGNSTRLYGTIKKGE